MEREARTSATDEFARALTSDAGSYGVALPSGTVQQLTNYYDLIQTWNRRLHLVAPCAPEEFAHRHILESLFALHYLPPDARVIDVGAGAGLPLLPCLLARRDLRGHFVEASARKAVFLREAVRTLGLSGVATVHNNRFEEIAAPPAEVLTCRALDRFSTALPHLLAWGANVPRLLLFGGPTLQPRLNELTPYDSLLLPHSEQRYLYIVTSDK